MIPDRRRMCLASSNPEAGKYGDCVRACIATLIDRDDVPHAFTTLEKTLEAWAIIRAYLAEQGKNVAVFMIAEHFEFMHVCNPGVPYMMMHQTHHGAHAIVCQDGAVLHDPAWYKSAIEGPLTTVNAYIIAIITDLVT